MLGSPKEVGNSPKRVIGLENAAHLAANRGRAEELEMLLTHVGGEPASGTMSRAIASGDLKTIEVALKFGARATTEHVAEAAMRGFGEIADRLKNHLSGPDSEQLEDDVLVKLVRGRAESSSIPPNVEIFDGYLAAPRGAMLSHVLASVGKFLDAYRGDPAAVPEWPCSRTPMDAIGPGVPIAEDE